MSQPATEELRLFVAEARRLSARSFFQHFQSIEEIGFSEASLPDNTPTVEQLESYLLHFRKFIQKNDRVYIHRVNQYVHELAKGHDIFLSDWNELHTELQEYLEAKALTGRVITHIPEIPDLSLLDLFKARTFSDLSHLDPRKQILHQKLSSTKQLDGLYQFEYYTFLFEVGEITVEMADLCSSLLNSLNSQI